MFHNKPKWAKEVGMRERFLYVVMAFEMICTVLTILGFFGVEPGVKFLKLMGPTRAVVAHVDSPLQKAVVGMTNEVTEIGWRKELATENETVSGHQYVMFSLSGDTNDLTSIRKAWRAVNYSGPDYSRRGIKDSHSFETYVVRLNYRNANNQWETEYVTMQDARFRRAEK